MLKSARHSLCVREEGIVEKFLICLLFQKEWQAEILDNFCFDASNMNYLFLSDLI